MEIRKTNRNFPTTMNTLSEVLNSLRERGIHKELMYSKSTNQLEGFGKVYNADELLLVKTYRFEGMSDPSDNAALYLLEDVEGNIGLIIDVYGSESNYGFEFNEYLKSIPVDNETT